MDIKGGKPVANREKQRPSGAKTKTHFSGHSGSPYVKGAQSIQQHDQVSALKPVQDLRIPSAERVGFSVPKYEAPLRPAHVVHKRLSKRALILRTVAMCLVVFVTAWGLLLWNGYLRFHKVFHGKAIVAALATKPTSQPSLLSGEAGGRVNILLMGTGESGTSRSDVTDEIMLLSLDTANDSATLVSLPPDLWVQQPVTYYAKEQKLDLVYKYGKEYYQNVQQPNDTDSSDAEASGISNLDQVVERITGVGVNYNVLINFQGFQQAVDAVGSISVNVPTELRDPSLAWYNHGSSVIAQAGTQTMNGAQALLYVRSHESTSNFASLQRQLQVLVALKEKALSAGTLSNPEAISELTSSLSNNFYTDLSLQNAVQFYTIVQKISDSKVNAINLTDSSQPIINTSQMDGETVILPDAGYNQYAAIQEYVRGQMPNDALLNEDAPITVMSKTQTGAQITGDYLKSYGYDVTTIETTSQPVDGFTVVDLSNGKDPKTLNALETHYGVKAVDELPAGIDVPPGSAKFVIIEP